MDQFYELLNVPDLKIDDDIKFKNKSINPLAPKVELKKKTVRPDFKDRVQSVIDSYRSLGTLPPIGFGAHNIYGKQQERINNEQMAIDAENQKYLEQDTILGGMERSYNEAIGRAKVLQ